MSDTTDLSAAETIAHAIEEAVSLEFKNPGVKATVGQLLQLALAGNITSHHTEDVIQKITDEEQS